MILPDDSSVIYAVHFPSLSTNYTFQNVIVRPRLHALTFLIGSRSYIKVNRG
jgi:hypothetical protein